MTKIFFLFINVIQKSENCTILKKKSNDFPHGQHWKNLFWLLFTVFVKFDIFPPLPDVGRQHALYMPVLRCKFRKGYEWLRILGRNSRLLGFSSIYNSQNFTIFQGSVVVLHLLVDGKMNWNRPFVHKHLLLILAYKRALTFDLLPSEPTGNKTFVHSFIHLLDLHYQQHISMANRQHVLWVVEEVSWADGPECGLMIWSQCILSAFTPALNHLRNILTPGIVIY